MSFVGLHTHSDYSLLDGASQIPELIDRVIELGMPAIALTDHGVMYGAIELIKVCRNKNVKPIVGNEMYVVEGDIEKQEKRRRKYHQIVLAKDTQGYKNLVKLTTISHLQGVQGKGIFSRPCINRELLEKYHEGLIVTSGCRAGQVPQLILQNKLKEARECAKWYQDIFKDDYYLEIQDHGYLEDRIVNVEIVKIAQELGIKVVATNDSHFTGCSDVDAHDALLCINTGQKLIEEQRMRYSGTEYLKSPDEMAQLFRDHLPDEVIKEAINNTLEVANKVKKYEIFNEPRLPDYPVPPDHTASTYLEKLAREGLQERCDRNYADIEQAYKERLEYELKMIEQMGFSTYFLVVGDYIRFARDKGIPVGPGRGSAAGSLVAYALKITNIDPVHHGLLFERFLNPERKSMPDIDTDFCIERRQEVIDYVTEKYGKERVAQIITFNRLTSKAVLKDVARVLDIPYKEADEMAKMIPVVRGKPTKLKVMISDDTPAQEFKEKYDNDENVRRWIDMAMRIEGTNKTFGVHAAGVVISAQPLDEVVPLQKNNDGSVITQYFMEDLESLGLLKMDFLGLKNLTIIQNTLDLIEKNRGFNVNPDDITADERKAFKILGKGEVKKRPLEVEKTYKVLEKGHLEGIFQLESSGMLDVVKKLKPSSIEDISSILALYRPGPLDAGLIPKFIDRKHGREEIQYEDNNLEPILNETYGILVYQEQIMKIAQDLANYTLGQADILRRCLSGSTEVIDAATGRLVTLSEIAKKPEYWLGRKVFSLDLKSQKISQQPITEIHPNGIRDVWEITTKTNRTIKATDDHLFYTLLGWKPLKAFKVGDRIGLAKTLPITHNSEISDAQIKLTADLIGDGHLSTRMAIANSEVFWDEIVSIKYVGKEEVFDLTIPETHNFIANDFIAHNCMGKKKADEMQKQRELFIDGATKNGVRQKIAEKLFDQMVLFAEYCLSYDTEIMTVEYGAMAIGKIVEEGIDCTVYSVDSNGFVYTQPIAQFHNRGQQEVFEYSLEDGSIIRATKDHKFMTNDGQMLPIDEIFAKGLDLKRIEQIIVKIVSRKSLGTQPVYDIGVESDHNFILANGLVASNCFNKSHSTAYAYVTYQTAYLKANFTVEYMAALLTANSGDQDKVQKYIANCQELKIKVEGPDINRSDIDFTPSDGKILFGLSAIKNVGENAIKNLLEVRREGGKFKDLADLCDRINLHSVNSRALEALIKCGALDCLNQNRQQLIEHLPFVISWAQKSKGVSEQPTLFDLESVRSPAPKPPQINDFAPKEKLQFEKELLGFYVSAHPLKFLEKLAPKLGLDTSPITLNQFSEKPKGNINVIVMITEIKKVTTKKGEPMAILQIEDLTGKSEAVVFPKTYDKVSAALVTDAPLILKGKVDTEKEQLQLIVYEAKLVPTDTLATLEETTTTEIDESEFMVVLELTPQQIESQQLLENLRANLQECRGDADAKIPVIAIVMNQNQRQAVRFGKEYWVQDYEYAVSRLKNAKFNARLYSPINF
ncbi:MAG: DNA polymerase III subunit alpha [Phormidium sp.]